PIRMTIAAFGLASILATPAFATRVVYLRGADGKIEQICIYSSGITSPPQNHCQPYREPPLRWRIKGNGWEYRGPSMSSEADCLQDLAVSLRQGREGVCYSGNFED